MTVKLCRFESDLRHSYCACMKETVMLTHYFSVLIFMMVALLLGVGPILISVFLSPRRPNPAKLSTYECGFEPFSDTRMPFDVRFYLVAILFIIFDLETAFLFPWAVSLRHIGWSGFIAMFVFLSVLIVGFVFEWRKGALEWE